MQYPLYRDGVYDRQLVSERGQTSLRDSYDLELDNGLPSVSDIVCDQLRSTLCNVYIIIRDAAGSQLTFSSIFPFGYPVGLIWNGSPGDLPSHFVVYVQRGCLISLMTARFQVQINNIIRQPGTRLQASGHRSQFNRPFNQFCISLQ